MKEHLINAVRELVDEKNLILDQVEKANLRLITIDSNIETLNSMITGSPITVPSVEIPKMTEPVGQLGSYGQSVSEIMSDGVTRSVDEIIRLCGEKGLKGRARVFSAISYQLKKKHFVRVGKNPSMYRQSQRGKHSKRVETITRISIPESNLSSTPNGKLIKGQHPKKGVPMNPNVSITRKDKVMGVIGKSFVNKEFRADDVFPHVEQYEKARDPKLTRGDVNSRLGATLSALYTAGQLQRVREGVYKLN